MDHFDKGGLIRLIAGCAERRNLRRDLSIRRYSHPESIRIGFYPFRNIRHIGILAGAEPENYQLQSRCAHAENQFFYLREIINAFLWFQLIPVYRNLQGISVVLLYRINGTVDHFPAPVARIVRLKPQHVDRLSIPVREYRSHWLFSLYVSIMFRMSRSVSFMPTLPMWPTQDMVLPVFCRRMPV